MFLKVDSRVPISNTDRRGFVRGLATPPRRNRVVRRTIIAIVSPNRQTGKLERFAMRHGFYALGAIGLAAGSLALPPTSWAENLRPLIDGAPMQNVQIAQATGPGQPAPSSRELVQRVQQLLILHGFDPGPADGLIGDRTTRSVRSFQQRAGIQVDGRVTQSLFNALQAALAAKPTEPAGGSATIAIAAQPSQNASAAAVDPAPPLPVAVPTPFVDSVWKLSDPGSASLTLRLEADGKVADVESPKHWKWRLRSGEILINYDNGLGGKVERRGRIVGPNSLQGTATSSRDREWEWRATRVTSRN